MTTTAGTIEIDPNDVELLWRLEGWKLMGVTTDPHGNNETQTIIFTFEDPSGVQRSNIEIDVYRNPKRPDQVIVQPLVQECD